MSSATRSPVFALRTLAWRAVFASSAFLVISACSKPSDEDTLAAARKHLAAGDIATATIELKSLVQSNPTSPQARIELGRALLETDNFAGAEIELRKAIELGIQLPVVVTPLARALIGQAKYTKVVPELASVRPVDDLDDADLQTSVATAQMALGNRARAGELVANVLRKKPGLARASAIEARLLASDGQFEHALEVLQKVLAKDLATERLEGDIQSYGRLDFDAAIAAYRRALGYAKGDLATNASLVSAYISKSDLDAASEQLRVLRSFAPANYPYVAFFEAQIAYKKGDRKRAQELMRQVDVAVPDDTRVLGFSAFMDMDGGQLASAERKLGKILSKNPNLSSARKMLARVYLRAGNGGKALTALQPLVEKGAADPEVPALLAESNLVLGDFAAADRNFAIALRAKPGDVNLRTSQALNFIASGKTDQGLAELRALARSQTNVLPDLALISASLKRGDPKGALDAVAVLEPKMPDSPVPQDLKGQAYLSMNAVTLARQAFEAALAKSPSYYPSAKKLAVLDVLSGDKAAARGRFESVLKSDPTNVQAHLGLVELKMELGAPKDEIATDLANASKLVPADPALRVAAVNHLLMRHDANGALTSAQTGAAAFPDDIEMLDALGRAQLAKGEQRQATTTFSKLASLIPNSPAPYLRLAEANVAAGDTDGGARALKQALSIAPDYLPAQRGLVGLAVQAKQFDQALRVAKEVQKQRPGEAVGYLLEGDIYMAQRKWAEAGSAMRRGLSLKDPGALPGRLHLALHAAGKAQDAESVAATWVKDHPEDIGFLLYWAEFALAQKNWPLAESRYRLAVDRVPDSAQALNGLAWTLAAQKKTGATATAQKALARASDNPVFIETYALALASEGKRAEAIAEGQKAIQAAPQDPRFKVSLAKLYLGFGDRAKAKSALQAALSSTQEFASKAEAQTLLKSL